MTQHKIVMFSVGNNWLGQISLISKNKINFYSGDEQMKFELKYFFQFVAVVEQSNQSN